MPRPPAIHHCTSEPYRFFGREAELALLDDALRGGEASVVAMIGQGGQGKTAIVQHWLPRLPPCDGVFLWSFYRGKDSDLCLREMLAYAEGLGKATDVAASYCVDRLVATLRRERWALVLDGTEIVQHEQGAWLGRFVHPELGRLLEELATALMPGVVVLTSRFPMPTLAHRRHARTISLSTLDDASGTALLASLGVRGSDAELAEAAHSCGLHAKAVELLGTYLARFHAGDVRQARMVPAANLAGASTEEAHVARVLLALKQAMPMESQDILALTTSFRQPPTEERVCEYLLSEPLRHFLHDTCRRSYDPFSKRSRGWLRDQVQSLVELRLLERVAAGHSGGEVLDAHPLVRAGFEGILGNSARTRAGFLRGRPDRRAPESLEEAREEIELFHTYADAGLWNEADSTLVALANPKHRFLPPALERDLLLRFYPHGDWRAPPLWPGFGRHRSLAICFEMLGQFEDAIDAYRPADAPLRGDALLALGRLQPILDEPQVAPPWQTLWQAYRCHALCLAGRTAEALRIALALVPTDIYEWVHVFECLLRLGRLDAIDLQSILYRPPFAQEHRFTQLARERMRLDWQRLAGDRTLGPAYSHLLNAYDRGGLPVERVLTRLSYARFLQSIGDSDQAHAINQVTLDLTRRFGMILLEFDALELAGTDVARSRTQWHYEGPSRP